MGWGTKMFLKIGLFVLAAVIIFPLVIMLVWNAIMPGIFGLGEVNFWEALGLLVLGKLLFSGFGFRKGYYGHRGHWRSHWHSKWERMTPEEEKTFYEKYGYRCGWKRKHETESSEVSTQPPQA
jgi:hypothetical protein